MALRPALDAQDLTDIFAQPDWQNPARPGDMFTAPEHTQSQVLGLLQHGGQSIEAGMNETATHTGAPPAPHAGDGGTDALALVRQTLRR